ncbi:MAG: DUF5946 family protein [Bacillota bacterium]|nr:serine/threonine protein kinase [Bacillota bacterium]
MYRFVKCPGCGAELPDRQLPVSDRYLASGECWELYGELTANNMEEMDPFFHHQLCVDAHGAQHSGGPVKPITTVFAPVGLYLAVERGFYGRQVQIAHMKLAKKAGKGAEWTRLEPPERPGDSAVLDVMKGEPGRGRKEMIQKWAKAVWRSWAHQHDRIRTLCEKWIL